MVGHSYFVCTDLVLTMKQRSDMKNHNAFCPKVCPVRDSLAKVHDHARIRVERVHIITYNICMCTCTSRLAIAQLAACSSNFRFLPRADRDPGFPVT